MIKIYPNPQIQVKATDLNTIKFSFIVQDNGDTVDLTGTIVRLAVKKPFGTTVIQDCVVTDAVGGLAEIILTNQAYIEVGSYSGELVITKDTDVTVTRSFEYSSLASIFDDETLISQNDWQALHEIMLNNDLRPILGEGNPNTFISPEYVGQTYLDTIGMIMYFASTVANDGWLAFGGAGGGGGPVSWTDVLLKPSTFPPETHSHVWTDITDRPTQMAPTAHQHDWGTGITNKPTEFAPSAHEHTIAEVTDLSTALDLKGDLTVVNGKMSKARMVTTLPDTPPEHTGQMAIDSTNKKTYMCEGNTTEDWAELAHADHNHLWADITDKPTTFTPATHSHAITDVTGLDTALTGKSDVGHAHAWTEITAKPTTFTPNLATTGIIGGVKVGNGLRMGGTGNEWLTLRDGVGIKTNDVSLAVDVDKPTLDGWYAKSTQGLSIWKGTQADYDLLTPDSLTLYFITG